MKLAFVLFRYFPFGGLQRDFLRIAEACVQRGHTVHAFAMTWDGPFPATFPVTLIPARGLQNHTRILSFLHALPEKLTAFSPDIVTGFNKMPGLDVYYAADTCFQARAREKHGRLFRLTSRYRTLTALEQAVFAGEKPTQILLPACAQQAVFMHYYNTPAKRFHVLPPGIAREHLRNDTLPRARKTHFQLLFAGSGFRTKGLDRALAAVAALPPVLRSQTRIAIAGEDRSAPFLRAAKRAGILSQTDFLGGRHDMPALMQAADLLIHPARHENTGTVLLEATAAGLPVLTTDACGYAHYIVSAGSGCVLPEPFCQTRLNTTLASMLVPEKLAVWQTNAVAFARTADIYSLPERAADVIVSPHSNPSRRALRLPCSLPECFRYSKKDSILFEQMMQLRGETFRLHKHRRTQKICAGGETWFLKQHAAAGWREIFRSLSSLRWPVTGADREWHVLRYLRLIGLPAPCPAGYGSRGFQPATRRSFLLTRALPPHVSLEDLVNIPLPVLFRRHLIESVATLAGRLHYAGVNHRDLYLCHFLLERASLAQGKDCLHPRIHVIDLHRAVIWRRIPHRWLIRDLAGLDFSSRNAGLNRQDKLRFMRAWSAAAGFTPSSVFWKKVKRRADCLCQKHGI